LKSAVAALTFQCDLSDEGLEMIYSQDSDAATQLEIFHARDSRLHSPLDSSQSEEAQPGASRSNVASVHNYDQPADLQTARQVRGQRYYRRGDVR
jgi:hypothetical protein